MRAVALMEAVKGAVVLGAGFGLLSLLNRDVQRIAAALVTHVHIDPQSHYAALFLDAANKLTDARLWALAAFSLVYAAVRFAEGYGMWFGQRWGSWLGAVSGAIYVPVEVYELLHRPSALKVGTLSLNVVVVAYLVWTLRSGRLARAVCETEFRPRSGPSAAPPASAPIG